MLQRKCDPAQITTAGLATMLGCLNSGLLLLFNDIIMHTKYIRIMGSASIKCLSRCHRS